MEKIKGAFLAAIGEPATLAQIQKHSERLKRRDQLQGDLNRLNAILDNLQAKYNRHKYQIFFIRNWLMKSMIRSAVERAQRVFDGTQHQPKEPEDRGQLGNYVENMRKINELKQAYHVERNAEQVVKEARELKVQIERLEKELGQKRILVEQLKKDYQTSKSMSYSERYIDMKRMIKATFRATT